MALLFSVVIPTHNRLEALGETLAALEAQEASAFEVVVVVDGATDGTEAWLRSRRACVPARIITQARRGPAAARNRGVAAAAGEVVAFLGDDTVPAPGWLAAHRRVHEAHTRPVAVVGRTDWHLSIEVTPFLRYINQYGAQFGYALIDDPADVPFNFFYTANLSAPRRLLRDQPFDECFTGAAWEDIELGYRLTQQGVRLVYAAEARARHRHPTDLRRFLRRQEKAGEAAVTFYRLHPELGSFLGLSPKGPPPLPPRPFGAAVATLAHLTQRAPRGCTSLWKLALRHHYLLGLHAAWARQDDAPCAGNDTS